MARPKTPTSILEFKGAFKKDPQRKREGEPRPTAPLGNAPRHLKGEARKAWHEIVKQCHPGVLTRMDRSGVEAMARAIAWMRTTPDANPGELKTVMTMLGKFGMTPSDRASLVVPQEPKHDDFDDY